MSDVAERSLGKMLDAKKNRGRPLPYLRNPNVRWLEVDTTELQCMLFEPHEDEKYGLQRGDVIICEGGEAGRAAIWDGRLTNVKFQKALHRVRPGPQLDAKYLVHCLMADYESGRLSDYYTGTTIKHLTGQDLARYRFPLPPILEQRRIAEILDKTDALRAKRRAALAQLDTLTQAIFLDMFENPARHAWPITNVQGVAHCSPGSIRSGPFGSQLLHGEFTDSGVAVLGIDNVVANEFRWAERRYIDETKYRQLRRYTVRPGDVLITIMGTCGRCAVVPDDIPTAINTKHLCCITVDQAKCLPLFLQAYFLRHPMAEAYLRQTAKGAIMAGLNMEIIKAMPIPLPPLDHQRRFAIRVSGIQRLRADQSVALAQLDALFASLQHRAFRGEL